MSDGDIVKVDFMLKRAQLKGRFNHVNYKNRWFVLTKTVLRYHDGTLSSGQGKEKGRVDLNAVIAVENADEQALDNRPNAFQVIYKMPNSNEPISLYIFANFAQQRDDWLAALRKTCESAGSEFAQKYHPGVWDTRSQRYSCCDRIKKSDEGCQGATYLPRSLANGAAAAAGFTAARRGRELPQVPGQQRGPAPPPKPKAKPSPAVIKKVIALYNYEKAEEKDLSLVKGDVYDIIDDSQQYWWMARNQNKEEGYIPANYVEEQTDQGLESYDWFYPKTSRSQSEEILKREAKEGCFLVRDASQKGMYTLSIFTKEVPEGVVRHYHIKINDRSQFFLSDKHAFDTIPDLIYYHKHNSAGLIVRLRSPPVDRSSNQPTTAGFGHDLFEIDPADLEMAEELGRGQFGVVRRARFRRNMDVAVKEMNNGTMSEDDFIEEARTMMKLKHPNLVQFYGVSTKNRPIYIICEYMKHGALLQFLRRRKGHLFKQPDRLLKMCIQVCDAMTFLEKKNFIHRDLAARNCLVSDKQEVKVADFGLARFVLDDEYTCSTGTKFPIKWASPEVLQYTKFSSKSDVWAFGILMWEIYTGGDMPYGRTKNTDVIEKVVNNNYRLEKPDNCPPQIYSVILQTWQKAPELRPSFESLLEDLQRIEDTVSSTSYVS